MLRNLQIGILSLLALLFAALLMLDVAWFFNGSLELFPTHEQQGKTEVIAVLLGAGFAFTEAAILFFLRRLFRKQQARSPRAGIPCDAADNSFKPTAGAGH